MKKNGYSKYTINYTRKALQLLNKNCDLEDPDSVKEFIARQDTTTSYKRNLCYSYEHYLKHHGLTWIRPRYRAKNDLPKIPTENKIDMIISASYRSLALKLKISKETGLRPIEVVSLRTRDVDFDKGLLYPSTAKHGSGRVLKLKQDTLSLLKLWIQKNDLGLNDKLFNDSPEYYGKKFRDVRNRVAEKLNDPSLKSIRLYDLRHFYATMLYHKTKDILYVKQQLGHKKLNTTLRYTQLINFREEEYTVKIANNIDEAIKLLESGFEYITDYEGKKLFRKRK
jgi:integrase